MYLKHSFESMHKGYQNSKFSFILNFTKLGEFFKNIGYGYKIDYLELIKVYL